MLLLNDWLIAGVQVAGECVCVQLLPVLDVFVCKLFPVLGLHVFLYSQSFIIMVDTPAGTSRSGFHLQN